MYIMNFVIDPNLIWLQLFRYLTQFLSNQNSQCKRIQQGMHIQIESIVVYVRQYFNLRTFRKYSKSEYGFWLSCWPAIVFLWRSLFFQCRLYEWQAEWHQSFTLLFEMCDHKLSYSNSLLNQKGKDIKTIILINRKITTCRNLYIRISNLKHIP